MPSNPTISKKQKTLDTLFLQMDIQSRAIRMTRSQRQDARRLMEIIFKTDKK